MAQEPRYGAPAVGTAKATPAIDAGLRAFMLAVYNHMGLGVAITGVAALGVFMLATTSVDGGLALTEFGRILYTTPLKWAVILAPLAVVIYMSFASDRLSASAARTLFYVYAALVGLSMSALFLIYTGGSVARVFFITAATFGALSLYGYTTKRDLSGLATFLFMGLVGLLIGMIVNLFLASSAFEFVLSVGGVLIFAGLTAWDTQKLKSIYDAGHDSETSEKLAVFGALTLYLDFINMFMFLLRLMGDRR